MEKHIQTPVAEVYQVCIPHTHRDFFDYSIAPHQSACVGARVMVPFRKQTKLGLIIGKQQSSSIHELKLIQTVLDNEPVMPESMLNLCRWVAQYYQAPLSEILPLALPKVYRQGKAIQIAKNIYYQLTMPSSEAHKLLTSRAHKQHAIIDFLAQQHSASKAQLKMQGFNQTQLDHLLAQQIISRREEIDFPHQADTEKNSRLSLNAEQEQAVKEISRRLHEYCCFLLYGVTGSGKTEVYLQVIEQVLAQGRQVLVLVPEIGLTPQLLQRFSARFSKPMAIIHSGLNESERQSAWQLAKDNLIQLIIGTRTAIFTPMPNLGLIVIDEEHDSSFKQMEGVRYSARDTALVRAQRADIPIILGSATPSLESLHNCAQNKYQLLRLNSKAISKTPLHFQLLDVRNKPLQQGLAAQTLTLIGQHLNHGNQVLVFINRRGYSPVLLCHDCGWIADCSACDSHLTLHRQSGRLICHHCGLMTAIPHSCKACQNKELIPIGAGTQRIHEYLSQHFPNTTLLRIDRDEVQRKHALDERLEQINRGEAQLIVGTQMLAKGHHFPKLTLVVVLDADAGFYNQDFRALERLGQLLTQVAGRAGRAEQAGQVLIQTHLPHHPLLNLLIQQGYEAFSQSLLAHREQAQLPPYHFLALVRAQGKIAQNVLSFLHLLKEQLMLAGLTILGPAPAPLARKAHLYRMQLLIKAPSRKILQTRLTQIREWLTINKLGKQVNWNVDIDPMDLS
nr:primosomal protein N' [Legionella jordanis]